MIDFFAYGALFLTMVIVASFLGYDWDECSMYSRFLCVLTLLFGVIIICCKLVTL